MDAKSGRATSVPAIIHVHAAVFACWIVVFIAQAAFIRRGRLAQHPSRDHVPGEVTNRF